MLRKIDKTTKEVLMVTRNDWVCVYQNVKDQMHLCCQRFDYKIGQIIPNSRFDECHGHHLPLVLATTKSGGEWPIARF
jgi:hypothetical protein